MADHLRYKNKTLVNLFGVSKISICPAFCQSFADFLGDPDLAFESEALGFLFEGLKMGT